MPRVNLLVIRAREPEKLAGFYSTLGLRFTQHRHGNGPLHFAAIDDDGGVFEIYPLRKGEGAGPTHELRIGFAVDDVQQTARDLIARGAQLTTPPTESPWGLRAVIIDPEGHHVEITQPMPLQKVKPAGQRI